MRKWFIVLLAVIGFSGAANAQNFSIRLGPELTFTNPVTFGIGAQLNGKKLATFSSNFSLGIYGNLSLGFAGSVSFRAVVGPTVNLEFDRARGDAYFGLAFGLNGGSGFSEFIFGFVLGAEYQVTPTINLFSNLGLIVVPGTAGALDLGADFTISRGLDVYGKLVIGFRGTFGLGGGLKLKF